MEGALRICLVIKLFVIIKMKILKNTLERLKRPCLLRPTQTLLTQKYRGSPPNTFYGLEAYGTH